MRCVFRLATAILLLAGFAVGQIGSYVGQGGATSAPVNVFAPGKDAPHCVLKGTVVNSVTGEAVPRALVTMMTFESRSMLTDSEGHFSFPDVSKATISLRANKPGFTTNQRDTEQGRVQACSGSEAVTLTLIPAAVITGQITDANGDPVEQIPVTIGKYVINEGRRRYQPTMMGQTDENGKFRLANVDAGSYLLAAGPSRPQSLDMLREVVPVIYYPGVVDRSAAGWLQVRAGATLNANLTVKPVVGYKVSGRVAGVPEDARNVMVEFKNESGDPIGIQTAASRQTGEFAFMGIPAGTHRVHATAWIMKPDHRSTSMLTGDTTVSISRDVSNLQIVVAPLLTLQMNTRAELSDNSSQRGSPLANVRLMNLREGGNDAYTSPDVEGGFIRGKLPSDTKWTLKNVERGKYIAVILPDGGLYVQSARMGPVDLLREPVEIQSDQYPIEITLRDDGAFLNGTVENGNQNLIVAVPSGGLLLPPRGQAFNQDGSAKFQMILAPGDYTVYAFDSLEGVEYMNPKAMEKYQSGGVHVTLGPKEKKEITLKAIEVTP